MSLAWSVVLAVAASLVGDTIAVGPCDEAIIAGLRKHPECYLTGTPPSLLATGEGTHILISKGNLPETTKCVTASQDSSRSYVTLFLKDGSKTSFTMDNKLVDKTYIEETASNGEKYRLYVIHNHENLYSYYRCFVGNNGTGNGTPMVDVAVGCKNLKDPKTLAMLTKAKECFKKLQINNYIELQPCDC